MRILCSHRADVVTHNADLLLQLADSTGETIVPTPPAVRVQRHAAGIGLQHIDLESLEPAERQWVNTHKLNTLKHACVNARVRVTQTTNKHEA